MLTIRTAAPAAGVLRSFARRDSRTGASGVPGCADQVSCRRAYYPVSVMCHAWSKQIVPSKLRLCVIWKTTLALVMGFDWLARRRAGAPTSIPDSRADETQGPCRVRVRADGAGLQVLSSGGAEMEDEESGGPGALHDSRGDFVHRGDLCFPVVSGARYFGELGKTMGRNHRIGAQLDPDSGSQRGVQDSGSGPYR